MGAGGRTSAFQLNQHRGVGHESDRRQNGDTDAEGAVRQSHGPRLPDPTSRGIKPCDFLIYPRTSHHTRVLSTTPLAKESHIKP